MSSKRFTSSSVSGSRSANSSSTASVKSVPLSYAASAFASISCQVPRCSSPMRSGTTLASRCYQPGRYFGPRPAFDDGGSRRVSDRLALLGGRSASNSFSFAARSAALPVSKLARWRRGHRVLLLEPGGDLGEPGVARDERRRAGRRRLRGDHAERLGEDRRHDRDVGERQQMPQMPVLERAGEERPRRRHAPRAPRGTGRSRRPRGAHRRRFIASSSTCTPFCSISFPK